MIPYAYRIADFLGIDRRINPNNTDYQNLKKGIIPSEPHRPVRYDMLMGVYSKKGFKDSSSQYNKEKWAYILQAPFPVSDKCCNITKKSPAHSFQTKQKKMVIMATMADESRLRKSHWLREGCNAFDNTYPTSKPMSFWLENDVLQYIRENNLEIAEPYGEVIVDGSQDGQVSIQDVLHDYRDCKFCTTGCKRTGCIFCGFGITHDLERFTRLAEEEPKLCDYVMCGGGFDESDGLWKPTKDGMGYWFVLEWLNIHGNFKIGIPNREKYLSEYQTEETRKWLESEEK